MLSFLDEETPDHSSGVRQFARITFNDDQLMDPPKGKKQLVDRVVEGQTDKTDGL